ncbi:MAG: zinc-binding dehydrogenase [Myxococcales bacterium]|nr:zinc-binding dehydrogenase [Myxococcales bacterium]MDD9969116.1 zinc-binding dehydrogenase [Myxococcales bacterium]
MRAAVAVGVDADNPLSALKFEPEWPRPEAGPGQALIRLAATTINMHDLWSLRGVGVDPSSFPRILGCDIVGWDEDDRPVMVTGAFGDPDAGDGDETIDPGRSLISEALPGSFAEYTVVPRRNVIDKPEWLSWEEAACINVAWSTAYRMLFTRGRARPGERVLVQGAGGGVSTAATAMARAAGLEVVVSSRSSEKLERARQLGAHETVGVGERLREPVDLVIETVGAATWRHSLRAVRPGGRVVSAGATTGSDIPLELPRLFYRQISVIGSTSATRGETLRMLRFMQAAGLRPTIDSCFPFERIHQAFERVQQPDLFGNVVVEIAARQRSGP